MLKAIKLLHEHEETPEEALDKALGYVCQAITLTENPELKNRLGSISHSILMEIREAANG